jgi:hypothetical protein
MGARHWAIIAVVRLIQAAICLPLSLLCAISLPAQLRRADASVTTVQQVFVTTLIVACYLAVPAMAFKSARASSLVAIVFCILFTPYIAILLLFSGWSMPSAAAAQWLYYVLIGNLGLFTVSLIGVVVSFFRPASR